MNPKSKLIAKPFFSTHNLIFILPCLGIALTAISYTISMGKDEQLFILISTGVMAIFSLMFGIDLNTSENSTKKLEDLRVERIELTKKIEGNNEIDIFNTIQLSLNQLNEYYTINKRQATTSFRFSLFSIVIGLAVLVIGIMLSYSEIKNVTLTYLTGTAGILLEFIGGAYFFMYKKSLEQVNFFFGQLIKIQDTMLAINLAKGINGNENKKIEIQEKIIVSLLERSLK